MSTKPRLITLAALLSLGLFSAQGCDTWKGFGKDVSSLGDDIQGKKKTDADAEETDETSE